MRWGHFLSWIMILGIGGLLWAASLSAQPKDIMLDNHKVFTSRSRPAVDFPHMQHIDDAGIKCRTCHHRFKQGKNVVDEFGLYKGAEGIKCSHCHKNETGFRFKPELDATQRNLQQAYHSMCMGCHRQLKKENKKAGPITCGGCHPRENGPST